MDRLLIEDLISWKKRENRQPLILKGVRQCGKTFLLKEFGAKHYSDTAYFNFEGNTSLQARFEGDLDVQRIIIELGILRKKPLQPSKTLIIFDEIQSCPRALTALKYFCENAPEYHVVAAGSLLGITLAKPLSFPVGKVDFLTLRPMCFYEFLIANGENLLCDHLRGIGPNEPISDLFTNTLSRYLWLYFIIGGMPEALVSWLATHDTEAVELVQKKILDGYELDFAKYAHPSVFPKLLLIWQSIPQHLARENGKFIFSKVKSSLRAKDLEDALEWLTGAGLALRVQKIEKPCIPISSYADRDYFKLYMADIGLLRVMAQLPAAALLSQTETFREFKGALTENYVLCELLNSYQTTPHYWKSGNEAEVDFIVQSGIDIVPIEVKSGRNNRARSLSEYRKKYNPRIAIKASMNNVSGTEVKNIPLYMLWKIRDYVGTST